ncbi:hypothetical protein [Neptunicella sp. SCSIO 80796]|uniref:hypothetical protein n=1 Tax=Neptunicella plasticusilytica TaxID=3117012 RepID=UPI003A4E2BDC
MSITPGYKFKRKFIAIAIKRAEDDKGIDYIAAGATALAMLTKGVACDPWQTEQVSRELDNGTNGAKPVIHTGDKISVTGAVEMAGAGSVNTPVAYAPLLQMSGYDIKTDVATEVSHNRILNAANELDGTIYFYWEGMYHILLAGKCTLTTAGKIGELGYLNFEAKGIYGGTLAGAIPTDADFGAFVQPVEWSKANTTFVLDGQNLNMVEFESALNNAIEHDEGTEQNQIFINDWNEEGKFIIEAPALGTFDPFAIAKAGTLLPYSLTHGTVTGNIFKQASSGIQLMNPVPAEYKGKQAWDIPFKVIGGHETIITTQ